MRIFVRSIRAVRDSVVSLPVLLAPVLGVSVLAPVASAQPFIEFTVSGGVYDNDANEFVGAMNARVVFDASIAPATGNNSVRIFSSAVAAESWIPTPLDVDAPIYTTSGGFETIDLDSVSLTIFDGRWTLAIVSDSTRRYELEVNGAGPGIDPTIASFPNDPDAFAIDPNAPFAAMTAEFVNSTQATISWVRGQGFSAARPFDDYDAQLVVTVREVENPNPPEPCPGDFDGNGTYDFADVSAFLAIFAAGCP